MQPQSERQSIQNFRKEKIRPKQRYIIAKHRQYVHSVCSFRLSDNCGLAAGLGSSLQVRHESRQTSTTVLHGEVCVITSFVTLSSNNFK